MPDFNDRMKTIAIETNDVTTTVLRSSIRCNGP